MRKDCKLLLLTLLPLAACARAPGDTALRPDAQPSVRVAEAALTANAPEVALNVARNLLKSDPYNVPALLAQGAALYAVGDLAQAATTYRTALTVQPRSAEAQLGLGRVHLARDEAREAETAFRASLALEAKAPAWSNLGIALDMQNRHADAQAAYREALRLDPRNEGARSNLAVSMAMVGGGPLPAAGPAGSPGPAPMHLSALDPMAQPFAAEPVALRRRGRAVREAAQGANQGVAAYASPAPAATAPSLAPASGGPEPEAWLAAMPAAPVPATPATAAPAQFAPPQVMQASFTTAPVIPVAATGFASVPSPAAPAPALDPVAHMAQLALSPGGKGLLADGVPDGQAPRSARRLPARPAIAAQEAPSARPAPAGIALPELPALPSPPSLTAEPGVLAFMPAPAAPARSAPPADAVRALPARNPAPAAAGPVPVILASAPVQAVPPSMPSRPAAIPAQVEAPRRPALSDRFDPAAVPMPAVPTGARPAAMAPVPAERASPPEEGRWLRASR